MTPNEVTAAEATAKGARLLDKILPGWYKEVNLERLHMQSSQLCMLGQLFGSSVESKLAKEMYPEEYEAAKIRARRTWSGADPPGYVIGATGFGDMVSDLTPPEMNEELMALGWVCSGYVASRCDWSREVANRLAADELNLEAKDED